MPATARALAPKRTSRINISPAGTAAASPWRNEVLNAAGNATVTTQSAIQSAISFFYSEGPGGGHFENLMGYSTLGCGVYRTSSTITVVQDFR
jgi:hypothetical protein